MQEFDRFVRHTLKPQAYVRYGDDFLLFAPTRRQAYQFRQQAVTYLRTELWLTINPKNDIVIAAQTGLKFLGHAVTRDFAVVDKHTTKAVLKKVNAQNVASYRALPLVKSAKESLDWILLQNELDVT